MSDLYVEEFDNSGDPDADVDWKELPPAIEELTGVSQMMSELKDAIDWIVQATDIELADPQNEERLNVVIKAARRVANLDIEAAAKTAYEYVHKGEKWEDAESLDRERFIVEVTVAVNVALGITEDDDGD